MCSRQARENIVQTLGTVGAAGRPESILYRTLGTRGVAGRSCNILYTLFASGVAGRHIVQTLHKYELCSRHARWHIL